MVKVLQEQQQSLLTTLDLSRKIVRAIMSLSFTAILAVLLETKLRI